MAEMQVVVTDGVAVLQESLLCQPHAARSLRSLQHDAVSRPSSPDPGHGSQFVLASVVVHLTENRTGILLREVGGQRIVSIFSGWITGWTLVYILREKHPTRPYTHLAFGNAICALGGKLRRVEIRDYQAGTYFAALDIGTSIGSVSVDVRPSDGIALSLLLDAPIVVAEKIHDLVAASKQPEALDLE